jgi:transcriptional regulator with XRE-family HTH domain
MTTPSPLRLRRWVRGLRLRDLQEATGLLEVRLSQLERGELRLAGPRLAKLAAFYECSAAQLVAEMGKWCARTNRRFLGPDDTPDVEMAAPTPPDAAA